MQSSDRDRDTPPSAAAREHTRGRIDSAPPEQLPHAGLVDDAQIRGLMDQIMLHYDPRRAAEMAGCEVEEMPARAEDTDLYQHLLARQATAKLNRAVERGNESQISYYTGRPDTRSDISGLSAIQALENEMLSSAPIIYIFGPPGSGKTNFALLLSELWNRHHDHGTIGTNIRRWNEADKWIPRWPVLDEWLAEQTVSIDGGGITQADDAEPRLFVMDEASSNARGSGKEGYEMQQKFNPLLYKIRKANCGLIIIGHDGKDVHPAVRAMATIIERRKGEYKRAVLYEDVVEREGRNQILEINGVPETSYNYDAHEATTWSWNGDGDDDEEQERIRQLAEAMTETELKKLAATMADSEGVSLSQEEIGAIIGKSYRGEPFGQTWVSKQKRRYERGEIELPGEES